MDKELLNRLEKKIKEIKVEAFIINQGERQIFEYSKNKKVKEKPFKVYSITKTIVSLLIGILVDRGMISSLEAPIHNYFPEILNSKDSLKKEITIRHLLTMTSGMEVNELEGNKDWIETVLNQPLLYEPGTTFQYSSGDSHLLSGIVQKVSGMTAAEFAEENLFKPLNINEYSWLTDPEGVHIGGFGIRMKPEQLMTLGYLLLNNGEHHNIRIVSAEWIQQMTTPYKETKTEEQGTYGYGYQIWTYTSSHHNQPLSFYCASGIYGQNIFVVPKLKLVAVVKSQLKLEDHGLPRSYFKELLRGLENKVGTT
ncbi:serine hydrolase [Rossellomorea vietnamensis]|uniref:Serine hydrolase n=1 Tax=Rossellomorea vietnamensis TaxID=218284 RepID=A0A5D4KAB9_9BACI|nr:serine hydrolase [Rossellomorea vietnamensis]TYR74238.1 serine hydrolase [Rossellomorea vietnamensis]